ncbi:MAG: hypothetical protein E7F56_08085, partial [Limosilactobacillus fermentum]|nr:hypothetical protein [Limosilactobacillus fermentum]
MPLNTPPFITPFALVSVVLALGATNVVVNKTTNTNNGAAVVSSSSRSTSTNSGPANSASKPSDDGSDKDSSQTP